jgi:hypothetical protein
MVKGARTLFRTGLCADDDLNHLGTKPLDNKRLRVQSQPIQAHLLPPFEQLASIWAQLDPVIIRRRPPYIEGRSLLYQVASLQDPSRDATLRFVKDHLKSLSDNRQLLIGLDQIERRH